MSDNDYSDTLSTISTVSSLTSSDRADSPPPYSPPKIFAELKSGPDPEEDSEMLSSTLTTSATESSTQHESPLSSSSPSTSPKNVPREHSTPKRVENTRQRAPNHRSHESDRNGSSTHGSNENHNSNRSSPRARPPSTYSRSPRTHGHIRPPHLPSVPPPPPPPLIRSFPPIPPPPPAGMYMGANPWMHPAQGFYIHPSASSQSINFHGPAVPPQPYFMPHNNMGMNGMEEMRRGMEHMRRTMQHDMEEMRNSMRQAHVEMNSAFRGNRPRRGSRRVNNSVVVVGNQNYGTLGDDDDGGWAGGSGVNMVSTSVNGNGSRDSVVWSGAGVGSYSVSVCATGGGQAVSQVYVGSDGTRYSYNAYQGL